MSVNGKLIQLIKTGNTNLTKRYIKTASKAEVNKSINGATPLGTAVLHDYYEYIFPLFAQGADVNKPSNGNDLLILALRLEDPVITIMRLLQTNIKVTQAALDASTDIIEEVDALQDYDEDDEDFDENNENYLAVQELSDQYDAAHRIIEAHREYGFKGMTHITHSTDIKFETFLRNKSRYLDNIIDLINVTDWHDFSNTIKFINQAPKKFFKSYSGATGLGHAVRNGYEPLIPVLIARGSNVNQKSKYDGALHDLLSISLLSSERRTMDELLKTDIKITPSALNLAAKIIRAKKDPKSPMSWVHKMTLQQIQKEMAKKLITADKRKKAIKKATLTAIRGKKGFEVGLGDIITSYA